MNAVYEKHENVRKICGQRPQWRSATASRLASGFPTNFCAIMPDTIKKMKTVPVTVLSFWSTRGQEALPFVASLSFFLLSCVPLSANSVNMIQEAVREYTEGLETSEPELRTERFRRAQRLFQQVIADQRAENVELYTGLGNAALLSEQLGVAILAYRRALDIEPGHDRARQNLNYARQLLPEWVPRPRSGTVLDTFFFWHRTLSRSGRSLLASLCFVLAAALFAIAIRWRRPWARNTALLPAATWVILMALSVWGRWSPDAESAIVTAPEVVARSADSAGAPARFAQPLPAGTEVRIIEDRQKWVRIRLANGRDAWVQSSALTPVRQYFGKTEKG